MTPRKPTAGFWITVALAVVLAYPLSYGPCIAGWFPKISNDAVAKIYGPLLWCIEDGPSWIADPFISYLEWWSDSAHFFRIVRPVP
jgi:hypothetical protein